MAEMEHLGPETSALQRKAGAGVRDGATKTFSDDGSKESGAALKSSLKQPRNYEIAGSHASGGMGEILLAKDLNAGRTVAMKVMLKGARAPQDQVLRFIDEARITGRLEHPNIVPVHEVGMDERDRVFYTMKFVKGTTLKQAITELHEGGAEALARFPLAELLTVFQKTCDAVAFAHSKGVMHRDLKPENVMIGSYGEVLVMDWGLAKIMRDGRATVPGATTATREPSSIGDTAEGASVAILSARDATEDSSTKAGTVLGTPQFMSPEQARGEVEKLDQRSDIYSLGVILFQLLALRVPVTGKSPDEILRNVCAGRIEYPSADVTMKHCPGGRIPESLMAVARKALALDPKDRYATVPDLQADVARYQTGFATAAENAGLLKHLGFMIRRHKSETALIAAFALIVLSIGPYVGYRMKVERDRTAKALEDLRGTASTYIDQALALFTEKKPDEAMDKIDFALRLAPDNVDWQLLRAHKLEALEKLPEAIQAYQHVLELRPDDVHAKANLKLCGQLLDENGGQLPLSPERQRQLLDAIAREQRNADSLLYGRTIYRESDAARDLFDARLKTVMTQGGWTKANLERMADGTFRLSLRSLSVPDLSILRGMPVSSLDASGCGAKNVEALADLPLRELNLSGLEVSNLQPLRNLALRRLWLRGTQITDLEPLAGMPLEHLDISETKVTDIASLTGMPLRSLVMNRAKEVRDFAALRGMRLESLDASGTLFADASVLEGMPMKSLELAHTLIEDVQPLKDLPLVSLDVSSCTRIGDVSALAGCKKLRRLVIPAQIGDVSPLRKLTKLERLSAQALHEGEQRDFDAITSAEEFWRAADAQKER